MFQFQKGFTNVAIHFLTKTSSKVCREKISRSYNTQGTCAYRKELNSKDCFQGSQILKKDILFVR